MIIITQLLVRNCIIMPAFKTAYFITGEFPSHLSVFHFSLIVFTTVIIAAGGYIINDYFDVHMDEINKPGKNIVGKIISGKSARVWFYIFSLTGTLTGLYVAIEISKPVIGLIPFFTAVSLFMYSSFYKRRFLSGNLIVALLCALSVLIVGLYEPEFYPNFSFLFWFAIPAFLLTMIREMIKDIEDIDGDELSQCKTVPIVLGINKTRIIICILLIMNAAYLLYILSKNFYGNKVISFWSLTGFFILPLAGLFYLVITASGKRDYHYASIYTKILMSAGILTMYPFWYFFLR
jgi:4-hydroxybenzoate polyprenyltransferase